MQYAIKPGCYDEKSRVLFQTISRRKSGYLQLMEVVLIHSSNSMKQVFYGEKL